MTIDLGTLDQESTDCLARRVTAHNEAEANAADQIDAEEFLKRLLNKALGSYRQTDYEASVAELKAGAAQLDYASRQALIAQIQSALTP